MNKSNKQKIALFSGLILGGFHLVWAILVATGFAQAIYDFVLWAHMIHLQIVIGPFDLYAASVLVIFTFIMGYVIGWIGAYIWEKFHKTEM